LYLLSYDDIFSSSIAMDYRKTAASGKSECGNLPDYL